MTLFLISSTLSSGTLSFTSKEIIDNSVVLLKVFSPKKAGAKGSGILINLKNEVKILTNAHVCLAYELPNLKQALKKDVEFTYGLHSKNETAYFSTPLSSLEFSLQEDWCLIPLSRTPDYPVLTEEFLSTKVDARAFSVTYNHENSSNKPLSFFKGCQIQDDKEECKKTANPLGLIRLSLHGKKKVLSKINLQKHYKFSFPTISGDSGSPFFNSEGLLVGLITGRTTISPREDQTKWSVTTHIPSFMKKYKQ